MTYFVAALVAIPVTMFGIIGLFESREIIARFREFMREPRFEPATAQITAAPITDPDHELRFTQSLLALSRVRSPERDGSRELEHAGSSSLALVHHVQSRIPDQAA